MSKIGLIEASVTATEHSAIGQVVAIMLFSLLIVCPTHASIRTVSNDPVRPAQYAGIQAAIDAPATVFGDTIFVFGSATNYGSFTVTKRLVLIGAGYSSNNEFKFNTYCDNIFLNRDNSLINASGTVITGFNLNLLRITNNALLIEDITAYRNYVRSEISPYWDNNTGTHANNWLIYNNLMNGVAGNYYMPDYPALAGPTNIRIANNIIFDYVARFRQPSVSIENNLFLGQDAIGILQYAILSNNIFIRSNNNVFAAFTFYNPACCNRTSVPQQCTFSNNLSNLPSISPNAPTTSFFTDNNIGGGNWTNVMATDIFQSITNLNAYDANANYRLKLPANYVGTDGTQIGIYGGAYPFPSGGAPGSGFDMSAAPNLPQITSLVINNAAVKKTNNLQVELRAKVNN